MIAESKEAGVAIPKTGALVAMNQVPMERLSHSRDRLTKNDKENIMDNYVALHRSHTNGSGVVLTLDSKNGNYYYEKYYCNSLLDAEILARQLNKLVKLEKETDSN